MKPSDDQDELLHLYRQASDAQEPRPAPAVRNAVLAQAHRVAREIRQGAGAPATMPPPGSSRRAANQPYFGLNAKLLASVMVLGFAGLLAWQFDSQPDVQSERTGALSPPDFAEQKIPATMAPGAPAPKPAELAHGAGAASQAPDTVATYPKNMAEVAPSRRSSVAAVPRQEPDVGADSVAGSAAGAAAPATESLNKSRASAEFAAEPAAGPARPAPVAATPSAMADTPAGLARPLAKAAAGAPAAAPLAAAADQNGKIPGRLPNQELLQAARTGDTLRVEQLLADGAEVDARDDQGRTALMLAVQSQQLQAARKLIELGARRSLTDPQGLTALDMARALGNEALLRLLVPAQ
jgi:hypothetical protein